MDPVFDRTPQAPMTLELKVDSRKYAWLKSLTLADVKVLCPASSCEKGKANEKQADVFNQIKAFVCQPARREGEVVVVSEHYAPPRSGYPGRMYSRGSPAMWSPLRSVLFDSYAELDQQISLQRIVQFVCRQCGVSAPFNDAYLSNRDRFLRAVMADERCSRKRAKKLFQLVWTTQAPLARIRNDFLRSYDKEAKEVRAKLMYCDSPSGIVDTLQWIVDASEGPGSFMARLTQLVEARLTASVIDALTTRGVAVHASIYDGIYVDRAHHGSAELQQAAFDACEAVAPGIGMTWGWKLPDPNVCDAAGNVVTTLVVPEDFSPCSTREDEWDPETQPLYDDFQDPREGYEHVFYVGMYSTFSQTHAKVGSVFVDSETPEGYAFTDESKLLKEYKHRVTYEPPKLQSDADGEYLQVGLREDDFIGRWLKDPRMDPLYNKDKSQRNYFKYFECYPNEDECPDECFNTWRGIAAAELPVVDDAARDALRVILEHVAMLCGDKAHYDFFLDLLAHSVQHPEIKLGIMMCLVGPKGAGKTLLWNLIQAIFGKLSCFETESPDRDVWGDNNSCIMDKYWVRITEASRKKFAGYIGEVRTKITDTTVRVRALYGAPVNLKSFHRFFCDTNYRDAIPDEHDERRFFVVDCCGAKIGDRSYFSRVAAAIESPEGVRAFYDFLRQRPCKKHYVGDDIPVGELARKLKDHNRSHGELFVQALVEREPVDKDAVTLSADQVYTFYKEWQAHGN